MPHVGEILAFYGIRKNGRPQVLRAGPDAVRELSLPRLGKHEARHSPSGFEWGYGGSGPAELARAILIALYPHDQVIRHPACYQHFKQDVIAELPRDFRLGAAEIRAWRELWDRTAAARRLQHAAS